MVSFSSMKDSEVRAIWSALQAMVNNIHAPQDQMAEQEWYTAEVLLAQADEEMATRKERQQNDE